MVVIRKAVTRKDVRDRSKGEIIAGFVCQTKEIQLYFVGDGEPLAC